jgi:hypothetical protein
MAASHVHAEAADFISRRSTGGQLTFGQHTTHFHKSRILANAVPLGFCSGGFSSTAGYVPATRLNFRRTTCPPRRVLFQRVLLVFIRLAQESLATSSSKPFGLDSGRLRSNSRLLIPSPGRHRTVCRSLRRSRKP